MMASVSKSAKMDPDTARTLFDNGAILLFLDVPQGTEFGIDYNSWQVGPKFKGVKMIPPGIHFVYYSAVSAEHQVAPRTGFFYNFQAEELVVKKWDKLTEDISEEAVSAEEQQRFEESRQDLDRFLGAYPYDRYKKWVSLTNHLRPPFLDSLLPQTQRICSVTQFVSERSTSQSRAETLRASGDAAHDPDDHRLPDMAVTPGTEIRFTTIPRQTYPTGAPPADITKYSLDHSFVLTSLLDTTYQVNTLDILAELQFSFICFLIGQVFEGFEQWKRLVRLLCSCDEAMVSHPDLYTHFISMMHYQILEIPEDFFVDIVSQDNFLVSVLHSFFENLTSSNTSAPLRLKGERFRTHLQKRFKWDFTLEPDEDSPVVVE